MKYNLFLDDQRNPEWLVDYKGDGSIYDTEEFVIVRTFDEFYKTIKEKGIPKFVSFDYILEKTDTENDGLDCAEFLKFECEDSGIDIPEYRVHSNYPGIFVEFDKILKK